MNVGPERIVRIFALGSPHGDDRVAWAVAERLSQDEQVRPLVYTLATPWDLVERLVPDCSVIVLDACVGTASPGTVLRFGERELAASPLARPSTHGGSLFESVELAKSLHKNIREFVVFAVVVVVRRLGMRISKHGCAAALVGDVPAERWRGL